MNKDTEIYNKYLQKYCIKNEIERQTNNIENIYRVLNSQWSLTYSIVRQIYFIH